MTAWRQRMGTEAAKAIDAERAQTAEWANAGMRNRGRYQFRVRGLAKVKAVVLWYALAPNLLRSVVLRAQVQAPNRRPAGDLDREAALERRLRRGRPPREKTDPHGKGTA